mgnify:CR=1 FL=1
MSPIALDHNVSWPSPERESLFQRWIAPLTASQSLLPQTLRIASADASFRRYLRIDTTTGESRIVMDAPPDKEDCRPFVKVAGLMADAGLLALIACLGLLLRSHETATPALHVSLVAAAFYAGACVFDRPNLRAAAGLGARPRQRRRRAGPAGRDRRDRRLYAGDGPAIGAGASGSPV